MGGGRGEVSEQERREEGRRRERRKGEDFCLVFLLSHRSHPHCDIPETVPHLLSTAGMCGLHCCTLSGAWDWIPLHSPSVSIRYLYKTPSV